MMRQMFIGKIHRATVTHADVDYEGSIAIDRDLMDAAGILDNEVVQVWNVTNGERLNTYAIPAPRGSGMICMNGAAAHKVKPGHLVILAAYGWMSEEEARKLEPKLVFVDENNRIKQSRGFEYVAGGVSKSR